MAKHKTTGNRKDIYQMVTDRIIDQLGKGVIPWRKPWATMGTNNPDEVAISHETGKSYSFLNQLLCGGPGEYVTFNQVQKLGGKIKKGEKSRIIVFWHQYIRKSEDDIITTPEDAAEDENVRYGWYLKYYNVWNIDQCEGIESRWKKVAGVTEEPRLKPEAAAEKIVEEYLAQPSHPELVIKISNKACYQPALDRVIAPQLSQYENVAEYYSTLFHELGHSTGHKDRLNRKGVANFDFFGSHQYSLEELVAEMTAAMLVTEAGLDAEKAFMNSVAYIQSWYNTLKNDPKMFVTAAGAAEKAAKWILDIHQVQEESGEEQTVAAA